MGLSRNTFYRCQEAKAMGSVEALLQKDWRRPNLKNRIEQLAHGQVRVSNELRKRGTYVSPSGVALSGFAMVWSTLSSGWWHWKSTLQTVEPC